MNYNSILNFIAALAEENNPLNVNHLALLKKNAFYLVIFKLVLIVFRITRQVIFHNEQSRLVGCTCMYIISSTNCNQNAHLDNRH